MPSLPPELYMAAAKSSAQRQREFKEAKKAKGLTLVSNVWAKESDHASIKAYAEALVRRAANGSKGSVTFNPEMWEPVKQWMLHGGEAPAWARRQKGLHLAFDEMTICVSDTEVIQTYYFDGNVHFTITTARTDGFVYSARTGSVIWMDMEIVPT